MVVNTTMIYYLWISDTVVTTLSDLVCSFWLLSNSKSWFSVLGSVLGNVLGTFSVLSSQLQYYDIEIIGETMETLETWKQRNLESEARLLPFDIETAKGDSRFVKRGG